jgi:hypothetical protein
LNGLIDIAKQQQKQKKTASAETSKLDEILSLLKAQQQQTPAVPPPTSLVGVSTVEATVGQQSVDPAASKGEEIEKEKSPPAQEHEASAEGEQLIEQPLDVTDYSSPTGVVIIDKGKKQIEESPVVSVKTTTTDDSDKIARRLINVQLTEIAAAKESAERVKTGEGEGSSSAIPEKATEPTVEELAAAMNVSPSELEEAKKLAEQKEKDKEATQAQIEETLKVALEGADDEQLAYHQSLTAEESQKLILQEADKKKRSRELLKMQKKESVRKEYYELLKNRTAPEEITAATVTCSADKKLIKLFIKRKGVSESQTFPNIQEQHLGVSEWVELYKIVAEKTSPAAKLLMDMMNKYFKKVAWTESKLGITDSILKISPAASAPAVKPSASKKRKIQPTAQEQPQEILINTNLPVGVPVGVHGEVVRQPELGMFYDTFTAGKRFYRAADMNLSSSEFLLQMYKICLATSNDTLFANMLLDEIKKRKHEPVVKAFYDR